MTLSFFNSISGKLEPFEPADPNRVRIYNCGPTVYNYNHIGNFRSYMSVDVLRRYLKVRGYGVDHTSNITDVDDKIINGALKEKKTLEEFTAPFIEIFLKDLETLNIEPVEHRPRATESIQTMHSMIQELEKHGHTYEADGTVYFRIDTFDNYGKLSGLEKKTLMTAAGGRFDADEYSKEDARDFALWKKPGSPEEASWASPWGEGRPGWHLECSAMIRDIYGEGGIDIHCGGVDLLFPHHENEIAQSCCAYPGDNFVRTWIHNEHLLVEGKKMSKSLGNFYTLQDLIEPELSRKLFEEKRVPEDFLSLVEKGKSPRAIRYLLLSTHYRTRLNFTFDGLLAAHTACERLQNLVDKLLEISGFDQEGVAHRSHEVGRTEKPGSGALHLSRGESPPARAMKGFITAMDEDLNIAKGLAALFDFIKETNLLLEKGHYKPEMAKESLSVLYKINEVLGVMEFTPPESRKSAPSVDGDFAAKVEQLIEGRNAARKAKDFAKADAIRDEIASLGVVIKDTPQGTVWEKE